MYEYAVVGKGMIGAAAARYLSQTSDGVVLIGPDEPQGNWAEHDGIFASHYDQGRITRRMDAALPWALWASRSIEAYPEIEAKSGIQFHYKTGGVQVGFNNDDPEGYINRIESTALQLGTEYEKCTTEAFRERYPNYWFDDNLVVLHERGDAGYVNPRSLVAAQVKICEMQGADIVREEVVNIDSKGAGVRLSTKGGQTIEAKQVMLATGAWTEFLTGEKFGFIPTPRTIVLAELDAAEAERLSEMPTLIWYDGINNKTIQGIYVLPPIKYPDGKTYIKLGGGLFHIDYPQDVNTLNRWFHGDGNRAEAEALEYELRRVVPGLHTVSVQTNTCVVTNRVDAKMPYIQPFVPGKVLIAAAGCGAAAKSSNEIGRLAALQMRRM